MCFVLMVRNEIDIEDNVAINYIHIEDACQNVY